MNTTETVSEFTEFFRSRGHRLLEGGTLVPQPGDPVLFTSAGMHPLTPFLAGEPHPLGRRLTGIQRCLRTTDLEEVGDTTHLTVFQMLGSWSLGDYDGRQSLCWGMELICDHFGLKPELLHATVFGGDDLLGPDTEALETWGELGLPVELLSGGEPGTGENWWSNGPTGPCGPDSEIFVWTGDGPPSGRPSTDPRWMELWNHVTMRYYRHPDGSLAPLPQQVVDTGMGLERLLMVSQRVGSVFDTDLFTPWLTALTGMWRPGQRALRILSDHLRSSIVVIADGVRPSNTGRGYVLRRLVRRSLTELWSGSGGDRRGLRSDGDNTLTLGDLPPDLVTDTGERFGVAVQESQVRDVLLSEERKFRDLVRRGRTLLTRLYPSGQLTDGDYEFLRETHGLPRELVTVLVTGWPDSPAG
ncbi:MAG TPA: alanine--tRNA ligase-related protein [Streptosporangiaceae bacterium]|nr:alanine--tRNA ligase-related protein [Streptosporangiaceae bacterium]